MILKNDFPHCPTCKPGGYDWKPQEGDTNFSRNLKRFSEQFNWFVQNVHANTEKAGRKSRACVEEAEVLQVLKTFSFYHTNDSHEEKKNIS